MRVCDVCLFVCDVMSAEGSATKKIRSTFCNFMLDKGKPKRRRGQIGDAAKTIQYISASPSSLRRARGENVV